MLQSSYPERMWRRYTRSNGRFSHKEISEWRPWNTNMAYCSKLKFSLKEHLCVKNAITSYIYICSYLLRLLLAVPVSSVFETATQWCIGEKKVIWYVHPNHFKSELRLFQNFSRNLLLLFSPSFQWRRNLMCFQKAKELLQ